METWFDVNAWPLYLLGFISFLTTVIENCLNPKKKMKKLAWYIQEFLYTLLSIALGISICHALETSQSVSWIVSIIMGLIGSTLIRKLLSRKDSICDELIDSVKNKAKSKIEN